jgi:hypothetical protein
MTIRTFLTLTSLGGALTALAAVGVACTTTTSNPSGAPDAAAPEAGPAQDGGADSAPATSDGGDAGGPSPGRLFFSLGDQPVDGGFTASASRA